MIGKSRRSIGFRISIYLAVCCLLLSLFVGALGFLTQRVIAPINNIEMNIDNYLGGAAFLAVVGVVCVLAGFYSLRRGNSVIK